MVWALLGKAQGHAIQEIEDSQSERIVAIVGGAMLDDTLRRTLEHRLRKHKDINKKLFKPSGALGALGPKVDLAFQMYVVDKEVRNAMYGLSEVRNLFAHNLDASFDSKSVKMIEALAKLTLHDGKTVYPSPFTGKDSLYKIETITDSRAKFLVNLKMALIFLMKDRLGHQPHSSLPTTTPIVEVSARTIAS